jgi:hypothetical protein
LADADIAEHGPDRSTSRTGCNPTVLSDGPAPHEPGLEAQEVPKAPQLRAQLLVEPSAAGFVELGLAKAMASSFSITWSNASRTSGSLT